jgi:hypothetical protein
MLIKVDDEEEFGAFLVELRAKKGLTKFLKDMATLYCENPIVQQEYNNFKLKHDPVFMVNEALQKLAMAHQQSMMQTAVLGDMLEQSQADIMEGNFSSATVGSTSSNQSQMPSSDLENKVDQLASSVEKLFGMFTQMANHTGVMPTPQVVTQPIQEEVFVRTIHNEVKQPVVEEVVEVKEVQPTTEVQNSGVEDNGVKETVETYVQPTETVEVVKEEVKEVGLESNVTVPPVEEPKKVVEPSSTTVTNVAQEPQPTNSLFVFEDPKDEEQLDNDGLVVAEDGTRTSPTFGKLMGSLKKGY